METLEDFQDDISNRFVKIVNSPRSLTLLGFGVLFFSAIAYKIFEQVKFIDALYWSFVTGTTLGYGDFAPHTVGGKVISVILVGATVIFFIPMVTASIASRLIVNRNAFTHEEQEEVKQLLREIHRKMDQSAGE